MGTANRRDSPDSGSLAAKAIKALRCVAGGLWALRHKEEASLELDEELRSYLEAATEDKMRRRPGLTYSEAMLAARLEMGNMESVKEEVRSAGWESALDSLWKDVHYGMRQLLRSPGFAFVAILTLALGIGANTAIFTLVHGIILKELPIPDAKGLYRVGEGENYCCLWGGLQDSWGTFDYPFYVHLRDTDPSFEQLAAFSGNTPSFSLRRAGSSEPAQSINGEYVSGNYFSTLGVRARIGRLLHPADDMPASPPVAVIGYRLWQRYFRGEPGVVGSSVVIRGRPFVVAGVAPEDFAGARLGSEPPELWIPLNQSPSFDLPGQKSTLYSSGMAWLYVLGRLRTPAAPPERVQSQLTISLQQWLRAEGRQDDERHKISEQRIQLSSAATGISTLRSNSTWGLQLLLAASGLVLLIACANIANLLLARSTTRRQQTALRLSLGAGRLRLIRAALTESVLLSVIGGAAGLLVAYAGTALILQLAFRGASYVPVEAAPSAPVFAFTFLLSIITGILFGVTPAWIGTKAQPAGALRSSSRSVTGGASMPQRMLVVVQAALSVVLLAVAGLVIQSLHNLEVENLGFETQGRLFANVSFGAAGYEHARLPAIYEEVENRLEAIPGVHSASLSSHSPQNLCCINLNIAISGRSDPWIGEVNVLLDRVSPRYFETLGTRIVRGRAISPRDTQNSPHVAVVDEAFASRFFPGKEVLGQHFGLSLPGHENDFEIIGVVGDTKYRNPAVTQSPMFFLPFTQTTDYEPAGYRNLETRTLYAQSIQVHVIGAPEGYTHLLRKALSSIDPNILVVKIASYREQVAVQYNQERLIARLTSLFSVLALLLASVGLYGVSAYTVATRSGEIGIRMALGASRGHVVNMVLRGTLLQVFAGLCIGVPSAILCGRYLASQLYGVGRFDPLVLCGAALLLLGCAFFAGLLPARRASSIRPSDALRLE